MQTNPLIQVIRIFAALVFFASAISFGALPALDSKDGFPTLAPMIQSVTPSVVNISVLSRSPAEDNPLFRDPFFRRFFDIPDAATKPQRSAGSGVIVDAAKGYVLTNHHVIKDAQQVIVTLKDRRQFAAQLVGTDPGTDIAVLKIDPQNLSALRFGDSEALNVGDFVVAIGNPFGLGQTVTSGIISALGRTGLNIEGYEDFIQTDASINPGNSGGALVSLRGELIGINTAIIGPAGGNVGIGFAVPANMVREVMNQIVRYGEVKRGRFGIGTQDLTPDLAVSLGINANEGALVTEVEAGSPADKAGIKPRDVILLANGKAVRGAADVRNRVALTPIGETVEFKVLREGKQLVTKAKVVQPFTLASVEGKTIPQLEGAAVANIERGMPIFGKVEGALVVRVEPNSPAWFYGFRPGDIIVSVNRARVKNIAELQTAMRAAERTAAAVTLLRGDFRLTILIR